eukprot:scaffold641_cov237-Pinguiococcus_pyrenoidosus.AAC.10
MARHLPARLSRQARVSPLSATQLTSRSTPPSPPPTIKTFLGSGCANSGMCAIISWEKPRKLQLAPRQGSFIPRQQPPGRRTRRAPSAGSRHPAPARSRRCWSGTPGCPGRPSALGTAPPVPEFSEAGLSLAPQAAHLHLQRHALAGPHSFRLGEPVALLELRSRHGACLAGAQSLGKEALDGASDRRIWGVPRELQR